MLKVEAGGQNGALYLFSRDKTQIKAYFSNQQKLNSSFVAGGGKSGTQSILTEPRTSNLPENIVYARLASENKLIQVEELSNNLTVKNAQNE